MEKVRFIWWMRSLSGIWGGEGESYMVDEVTIRDLGWRRSELYGEQSRHHSLWV